MRINATYRFQNDSTIYMTFGLVLILLYTVYNMSSFSIESVMDIDKIEKITEVEKDQQVEEKEKSIEGEEVIGKASGSKAYHLSNKGDNYIEYADYKSIYITKIPLPPPEQM